MHKFGERDRFEDRSKLIFFKNITPTFDHTHMMCDTSQNYESRVFVFLVDFHDKNYFYSVCVHHFKRKVLFIFIKNCGELFEGD